METENPFEIDFESYIRQVEPEKKEKSEAWAAAIGLQKVDGLTPSKYLYETAKRNIEGEISIKEAKELIDSYYESKSTRNENGEEEADKVSARITELLEENAFSFTVNELLYIYERLFKDVFYKVKAGQFRNYNITKKEWALDGDTVFYADAGLIRETLNYDFENEKNFDYSVLSKEDAVKHLVRFVANIWQVHPFGEGNTRTTAVFTIKYLKSLGFKIDNKPFEKNSWYFRNALVRANYTNISKGVYMNTEYLEKFFRNLLLGEHNELKNRFTHIRYNAAQNVTVNITQNVTVKITENQKKILRLVKQNPFISQKEIAGRLGLSRETVNRNMKILQKNNLIKRTGSDKNGSWQIL